MLAYYLFERRIYCFYLQEAFIYLCWFCITYDVFKLTYDCLLCRTVSSGISGASYYTGTFNAVNCSPDGRYVAVSSPGDF